MAYHLHFWEPLQGFSIISKISAYSFSEIEGFFSNTFTPLWANTFTFLAIRSCWLYYFFSASDFNLENFALTSICFPWFLLLFPTLANNLETSRDSRAQKIIKAAPQVQAAQISHEFCIKFCILNSHISSQRSSSGWVAANALRQCLETSESCQDWEWFTSVLGPDRLAFGFGFGAETEKTKRKAFLQKRHTMLWLLAGWLLGLGSSSDLGSPVAGLQFW